MIAEDPTAAALLAVVPCYPVPSSGGSPALDALRGSRAGHGLAVGKDGVMLILRRPWLALDAPVTPPIAAYLPYGSIGSPKADLRCGLIPGEHLAAILDHFRAALPNEAAAFILWNETTNTFAVDFPAIDDATPTRLVYRPRSASRAGTWSATSTATGGGPPISARPTMRTTPTLRKFRSSSAGSTIPLARSWQRGSARAACSWPYRAVHFPETIHAA